MRSASSGADATSAAAAAASSRAGCVQPTKLLHRFLGSCIDAPTTSELHRALRIVCSATERALVAPRFDAMLARYAGAERARDRRIWIAATAALDKCGHEWGALQELCEVPFLARSPAGWAASAALLRSAECAATPSDAVALLLSARGAVVAELSERGIPARKVGSDLILPIFIVVTIRARIAHPAALLRAMSEYTPNGNDAFAQSAVSLAAWEVALDVLADGGVGLGLGVG